jgi:hypothetical protein
MRYAITACGAVVVGLLAGCGSSENANKSSPSTVTVIEKTVTQQAPAQSQSSAAAPTPTPAPAPSKVSVPNEVGERLDVAEDDLRSKGLTFREVGGGSFGIVVRSNWTVCRSKPSAGTNVNEGAVVRLIVDRSC